MKQKTVTRKKGTVDWYLNAFNTMAIDKGYETSVLKAAKRVLAGKAKYAAVEKSTKVPWWVIGAIHYKEATCDFKACLHNGERIIGTGKKTRIVPIGKGPFATWEEAAIDAIKHDGLQKNKDWSIGQTLKLLEQYNGTGYLRYHPEENSPYLWAMTSINDDFGKYVSDGKFDSKAPTNKTTGAAAIIQGLHRMGEITAEELALS